MSQFFSFLYLVVSLLIITFLISFSIYALRNRKSEGAVLFAAWLLFTGLWLLVINLHPYLSQNVLKQSLVIELIIFSLIPAIYLTFMMRFTSHKQWLNSWRQIIPFTLPFLSILFGLLNKFQPLIWNDIEFNLVNGLFFIDYKFGYWLTFFWLMSFIVQMFVFYELLRIDKLPLNIDNPRSVFIKIAAGIIAIVTISALIPSLQPENLKIISLGYAISGLLIGFTYYRYELFDLSPFIYHTLLENLHDGIIVIGQDQRILHINDLARQLLSLGKNRLVGSTLTDLMTTGSQWLNALVFNQNDLVIRNENNEDNYYEIQFIPLEEKNNQQKKLILIRDVTPYRLSRIAEQSAREVAEVRAMELDVLRKVAERLNQSVEKKAVLSTGLETIVNLIGARFGYVVLADEFGRPGLAESYKLPSEVKEAFDMYPICPTCKSFERLLNGEYQEPITFMPCRVLFDISVSYPGLVSIPLKLGEKALGFLNLIMAPEVIFTGDEISLLQTLGDQFSAAIERARMYEKFEQLAMIDSLTGLYNRRQLFILGQNEFSRAYRYNHSISVVMLDIDLFKKVNDVYGHTIGDQVLQQIANRCRSILRSSDIIGRYGGEEFLILLPETNIKQAQKIANRMRLLVLDRPIVTDRGDISVTVSMGISSMEGDCDSRLEWVVDQADQALLQAKETGRNKVMIWQEDQLSLYK
jgi:diguanylate cyclase (GGDEF)-like protein